MTRNTCVAALAAAILISRAGAADFKKIELPPSRFVNEAAAAAARQHESTLLPPPVQKELEQAATTALAANGAAYLLRAGDELELRCRLIPELNQTVRVRPDGKISLVLVNDVPAAGQSPEALSTNLSKLYSQHYRNPQLTAIVRTFNNLNVYVGGDVVRAGLVPLGDGLTAAAAVFQAGGFKTEEGPKTVVLLRRDERGAHSMSSMDLTDVLLRGKPDIPLRPSDVLFVPRSTINVYVGGEVVEPGLVPLNRKMTVLSAVIKARGFKPTAQVKNVMLIREGPDGKPAVAKLNLKQVMSTGIEDVELQPYDVVFVPKTRIAKMDQFMDQYVRQLLPVGVNLGFSYLLGTALFQ